MITTIEIHNFKSIREMKLELGNINLFIGANGCGKSNILEAIGIISTAVSGIVDDEALLRRGVRPGVPRLYKTSNQKHKTSPHISFLAKNNSCSYKVSLLNPLDKPRPQWNYKTENFQSTGHQYKRGVKTNFNPAIGEIPALLNSFFPDSEEALFLQCLREYAIYSLNTPVLRGVVPDQQPRIPVGLSGGGLANGFADLLRVAKSDENIADALDEVISLFPWVQDVVTTTFTGQIQSTSVPKQQRSIRFTDTYMNSKFNKLTAGDASEGILYAIFLSVICLSPSSPRFFSIDNIDQALNPRLAKKIMQLLNQWFHDIIADKQLLCTAHNPSILDGFDIADEDVRLFVVNRNSAGLTVVNRVNITESLIRLSKEKKLPLSRLWLEGYLGGVPDV